MPARPGRIRSIGFKLNYKSNAVVRKQRPPGDRRRMARNKGPGCEPTTTAAPRPFDVIAIRGREVNRKRPAYLSVRRAITAIHSDRARTLTQGESNYDCRPLLDLIGRAPAPTDAFNRCACVRQTKRFPTPRPADGFNRKPNAPGGQAFPNRAPPKSVPRNTGLRYTITVCFDSNFSPIICVRCNGTNKSSSRSRPDR